MAFGRTLKAGKSTTGESTNQAFTWQWMSIGNGHRKFRILPEVENGELVKYPATDSVGKVIKNKFVYSTEAEVRWLEVWYNVMIEGEQKRARIILDWQDPWGNPLWKYVAKNFEKGSKERKVFKQRFGVNVIDMTPVLFDDKGGVIYSDINGVFNLNAKSKRTEVVTGDPTPLMQVRILEGSAGDEGGNHLLQQIKDEVETLEDNDGNRREAYEVTLLMKTTGEEIKTKRSVRASSDFTPLDNKYFLLPRYNIAEWAKPYPNEMLERILDGEDYVELVEEYKIVQFPQLSVADTKDDELFDD